MNQCSMIYQSSVAAVAVGAFSVTTVVDTTAAAILKLFHVGSGYGTLMWGMVPRSGIQGKMPTSDSPQWGTPKGLASSAVLSNPLNPLTRWCDLPFLDPSCSLGTIATKRISFQDIQASQNGWLAVSKGQMEILAGFR